LAADGYPLYPVIVLPLNANTELILSLGKTVFTATVSLPYQAPV
jgi:hypothetical protein